MRKKGAAMKYLKSKKFWEAAAFRAIRTLAQTFLAAEASSTVIQDVNWQYTVSAALLAAFLSLCTSVAFGIPEIPEGE